MQWTFLVDTGESFVMVAINGCFSALFYCAKAFVNGQKRDLRTCSQADCGSRNCIGPKEW